jgi:hypothetical protein
MTRSALLPLGAATATGAVAAFFFDPVLGRRRRGMLRQRVLASARRGVRRSVRTERAAQGRVRGLAIRAAHRHEQPKDYDDVTLAHKVETQLGRDARVPKGRFNVDACKGVVSLRGLLDDQQTIDRIVKLTRRTQGVRGVENLLHLPGTPPPNLNGQGRHQPVVAGERWQPHQTP